MPYICLECNNITEERPKMLRVNKIEKTMICNGCGNDTVEFHERFCYNCFEGLDLKWYLSMSVFCNEDKVNETLTIHNVKQKDDLINFFKSNKPILCRRCNKSFSEISEIKDKHRLLNKYFKELALRIRMLYQTPLNKFIEYRREIFNYYFGYLDSETFKKLFISYLERYILFHNINIHSRELIQEILIQLT